MKKVVNIFTVLIILFLLSANTNAYAQGFSALLKKLDKLENQLNNLDTKYNKEIESLKIHLNNKQGGGDSGNKELFLKLEDKIDSLKSDVNVIKSSKDSEENPQMVTALVGTLKELTGELRTTIEKSPEFDPEKEVETSGAISKNEINISGFVDASYFYDGSSGDNTFGLDQVELDFEKNLGDKGVIHTDLEWVSDGEGGFELAAEQGYVTFKLPFIKNSNLMFGKFNAPIGFELLDAPDMFQFSHALVFNYGLPTNLSGAMFSINFNPKTDLSLYICNGWDQNVDINTGKTVGGRLGYSFGELGGIGLSGIKGAVNGPEGDFLTVFDLDATLTPAKGWTFGGEINYGSDAVADTTYKWSGFLLMGHYDFNNLAGLTVRYDYFNDKDGSRLGSNLIEKRKAIAIAPTFALGDGMGALIEFRNDFSDKKVFTDKDGKPVKSAFTIAFEMTYTF